MKHCYTEKFDTMKEAKARASQLKKLYGDKFTLSSILNLWYFCIVELNYQIEL